jgi:hypothetical protein
MKKKLKEKPAHLCVQIAPGGRTISCLQRFMRSKG